MIIVQLWQVILEQLSVLLEQLLPCWQTLILFNMLLCPSASEGGSNLVWAKQGDLVALAVFVLGVGVGWSSEQWDKEKSLCKILLTVKTSHTGGNILFTLLPQCGGCNYISYIGIIKRARIRTESQMLNMVVEKNSKSEAMTLMMSLIPSLKKHEVTLP